MMQSRPRTSDKLKASDENVTPGRHGGYLVATILTAMLVTKTLAGTSGLAAIVSEALSANPATMLRSLSDRQTTPATRATQRMLFDGRRFCAWSDRPSHTG
jgi:hypothetical protein